MDHGYCIKSNLVQIGVTLYYLYFGRLTFRHVHHRRRGPGGGLIDDLIDDFNFEIKEDKYLEDLIKNY